MGIWSIMAFRYYSTVKNLNSNLVEAYLGTSEKSGHATSSWTKLASRANYSASGIVQAFLQQQSGESEVAGLNSRQTGIIKRSVPLLYPKMIPPETLNPTWGVRGLCK